MNALSLGLVPNDRKWLHERIALRFSMMLEAGFLDEMASLRQSYPALTPDLPSMRCVGYRQAWSYLDGQIDRHTFIDMGIAATRQLAKRQLTWMRSMDMLPVDAQSTELEHRVIDAVGSWLDSGNVPEALRFDGPF